MTNDEKSSNAQNPNQPVSLKKQNPGTGTVAFRSVFGFRYSFGIRHSGFVISHNGCRKFSECFVPPGHRAGQVSLRKALLLVWCLRNNYTFVALKLAWGEARGRECIPSDTRPTEQRSPRPISAQPEGRLVFWAEALLLAPYRSTSGYARRSRLASAQNPLPRMYSYFGG